MKVPGKDFVIRILLKKGKYSRKWHLSQHEIYAFKRGRRTEIHVGINESSLENAVLDRRRFYEITFLSYVRTRNARSIIPILWIKLEEDLILPTLPQPLQWVIFNLFYFFSLASHENYGWRWLRCNTDLIWVKEHYFSWNFVCICFITF